MRRRGKPVFLPFVDENERAGLAAAIAFPGLNGPWISAHPDELAEMVVEVAEGTSPKAALAEFIRRHVEPLGE